jgi:GNAT superfamily N-acetyltransferase
MGPGPGIPAESASVNLTVEEASTAEIAGWRDLYRREMDCQILHDSFHARQGWTRPFLFRVGGTPVGHGAVVQAGPWKGMPTLLEAYVEPAHRRHLGGLFRVLIGASGATGIRAQTNDGQMTAMLFAHCRNVTAEKLVFDDRATTAHQVPGALFRPIPPDEARRVFPDAVEPLPDWALEFGGQIVANGGVLWHYNRPYGDLYMNVAEPFRRRGFGTLLVQELKRVCRQRGGVPCARCDPDNLASARTLLKAGFAPCAQLLTGTIAERW